MKKILCVALLVLASPVTRAAAPPVPGHRETQIEATIPPVFLSQLKALEETYVVLDAVAEKVWPGWKGYRETPFLFTLENGVRVLVAHPNPPKEFQVVDGVMVGNKHVAVDRTHETALPLTGPLSGGGGVIPFGQTVDGKPVTVVDIGLRGASRPADQSAASSSAPNQIMTERQVLVYVHELFHCFQSGRIQPRFGNLMYNADAEYATWSNVEGLALVNAYNEKDADKSTARLKEFLVARSLKRRSMTTEQANEESADDVREGTATYATLRALEVIKAGGFTPHLTSSEDPGYHGFANVDSLIAEYAEKLQKVAGRHTDPKMKCYDYGCFQAALCQRLFDGWQQAVEKGQPIDEFLASKVTISGDERTAIESRLSSDYPVARIRAEAAKAFEGRDAAYKEITARKGRTYIVDIKAAHTYALSSVDSKVTSYTLGLIHLYPKGHPGFTLDEIDISPIAVPSAMDQLYYLRVVDTDRKSHKRAYTVKGVKQPDGIYLNAVVTTPLFTLKAPKVRIKETANRVKIQVLARVSEKKTT